jgi:Cd2+/Zn2+-exporting ATPase
MAASPPDWSNLSRLFQDTPAVEAVQVPEHGRSVLVATLGTVDENDLAAQLREILAATHGGGSDHIPGVTVTRGDDGTRLSRVTCPTSQRLWVWREIPLAREEGEAETGAEWREMAILAAVCGLSGMIGFVLGKIDGTPVWLPIAFHAIAIVAGGWDAAKDTWENLRKGTLDIHFLMLAAAAGSAALGAWGEAALLLFLFSSSGALEHFALHRTRKEIESLFHAAPRSATVIESDGTEHAVPVDAVSTGQMLLVRPGDQFPVDGVVVSGSTASDESALTGEANPIPKETGDEVFSGTQNLWGVVRVRVSRPAGRSALQKIIALIREAQQSKAPSQRFTDKFGTGYTWGVLALTLAAFLFWWLVADIPAFAKGPHGYPAIYRAMTLLVVASPCALVLSIPSAILAAIAWGARHGILFRGGAAVEKLASIDTVCLDKTGTLTTGDLQVTAVESYPPGREEDVARLAVSLEKNSTHPIARAITAFGRKQGIEAEDVGHFENLTGRGIRAETSGGKVLLGKRDLLGQGELAGRLKDIAWPPPGQTEVWIVAENLLGRILLRDRLRPESRGVLARLARAGIEARMLTGDRPEAAHAVAEELGLDRSQVLAGLHPEDKVAEIRRLAAAGRTVAMVGDGINDAPSLAAAHVSVAMGARGSDAALEQSEVVLMHDRIENFLAAHALSQAARRVIRQNITIALGTVVIMVIAALTGSVPLSLGVFAHEGSTVVVCLNSLRLLFLPKPDDAASTPVG